MTRYDDHADFQLARRGIEKTLVEEALLNPDEIEVKHRRQSFLKCLPQQRVMLRVVTPLHEPDFVVTAYFLQEETMRMRIDNKADAI